MTEIKSQEKEDRNHDENHSLETIIIPTEDNIQEKAIENEVQRGIKIIT